MTTQRSHCRCLASLGSSVHGRSPTPTGPEAVPVQVSQQLLPPTTDLGVGCPASSRVRASVRASVRAASGCTTTATAPGSGSRLTLSAPRPAVTPVATSTSRPTPSTATAMPPYPCHLQPRHHLTHAPTPAAAAAARCCCCLYDSPPVPLPLLLLPLPPTRVSTLFPPPRTCRSATSSSVSLSSPPAATRAFRVSAMCSMSMPNCVPQSPTWLRRSTSAPQYSKMRHSVSPGVGREGRGESGGPRERAVKLFEGG